MGIASIHEIHAVMQQESSGAAGWQQCSPSGSHWLPHISDSSKAALAHTGIR